MSTDNQAPQQSKVMTLWDHLDELRSRVVKSLIALVLIFFVCIPFADDIIYFLKQPLVLALDSNPDLHFTGPFEMFLASIKVSLICALLLSCPIWIFQLWKFVEPALYQEEKKYVTPFALTSILFFIAGVLFSYFIILPMTMRFMIGLGSEVAIPIITVKDYFSMVFFMVFGFGFMFELPILIVLLGVLDIVDSTMLRQYRAITLVGIFIMAALFTPPDPVSQIALAIPLYLMFEISIFIVKSLEKKTKTQRA